MLDKLKQLMELNKMKDLISKETAEAENRGVRVSVNGKMEVESIQLNPELPKEDQEKAIKDCINDAFHKIHAIMAQKLMKM